MGDHSPMTALARRVARASVLTAALGAATIMLATPATAAPVQAGADGPVLFESCTDPLAGVRLCQVTTADPDPTVPYRYVRAELRAEPGSTIRAGLVSIDACSGPCVPARSAAGEDTGLLATESVIIGRGTGGYVANATWVDGNSNRHLGVTI
jgi:hypothetical protein